MKPLFSTIILLFSICFSAFTFAETVTFDQGFNATDNLMSFDSIAFSSEVQASTSSMDSVKVGYGNGGSCMDCHTEGINDIGVGRSGNANGYLALNTDTFGSLPNEVGWQ